MNVLEYSVVNYSVVHVLELYNIDCLWSSETIFQHHGSKILPFVFSYYNFFLLLYNNL